MLAVIVAGARRRMRRKPPAPAGTAVVEGITQWCQACSTYRKIGRAEGYGLILNEPCRCGIFVVFPIRPGTAIMPIL